MQVEENRPGKKNSKSKGPEAETIRKSDVKEGLVGSEIGEECGGSSYRAILVLERTGAFILSAVRSQLRKGMVGGGGRGVWHDRIGSNFYFRFLPSLFYSQFCIICSLS